MIQNSLLQSDPRTRPIPMDIRQPRGARLHERRALLIALFTVYLVLLNWVVLWKLELPYVGASGVRPVKLVPFVSADGFAANSPLEVGVNVLLFVPFGIYLALLVPHWRRPQSTAVFAVSSLGFELTQFVLAVGSFDTTDLIANTAGGLIGLAAASAAIRRSGAPAVRSLTRWCVIGTCIAVLIAGAFVTSPLHFNRVDAGRLSGQSPR